MKSNAPHVHQSEPMPQWDVWHSLPASTYFSSGAFRFKWKGQSRVQVRAHRTENQCMYPVHTYISRVHFNKELKAMKPDRMLHRAVTHASLAPHPLTLDSGHTLMHSNVLQQSSCNSIINLQPCRTMWSSYVFTVLELNQVECGWSSGVMAAKDDILIPSFL